MSIPAAWKEKIQIYAVLDSTTMALIGPHLVRQMHLLWNAATDEKWLLRMKAVSK